MKNILLQFLLQVALTIGEIYVAGMIISEINKLIFKNLGANSRAIFIGTGFIGIPVHELSHALCGILFAHKITGIRLFAYKTDVDISKEGSLGYVNHQYNPKNLYQSIGNFFIGIAPTIVVPAIIYCLSCILVPGMMNEIFGISWQTLAACESAIQKIAFRKAVCQVYLVVLETVKTAKFWLMVLICLPMTLHMNLSRTDLKGSLKGVGVLLGILLVLDTVVGFFYPEGLYDMTRIVTGVSGVCGVCFLLSIGTSLTALLLIYLFMLIKLLLKKR